MIPQDPSFVDWHVSKYFIDVRPLVYDEPWAHARLLPLCCDLVCDSNVAAGPQRIRARMVFSRCFEGSTMRLCLTQGHATELL
jgi:hypothetical protein